MKISNYFRNSREIICDFFKYFQSTDYLGQNVYGENSRLNTGIQMELQEDSYIHHGHEHTSISQSTNQLSTMQRNSLDSIFSSILFLHIYISICCGFTSRKSSRLRIFRVILIHNSIVTLTRAPIHIYVYEDTYM